MDIKEVARMGGMATLKKYGKEHYKKIRKGRKNKKERSIKK